MAGDASKAQPAVAASNESVLSKQSAAADALTREAEQAIRNLAKQQQELDNRRVALESSGIPFPADHASNRAKKRARSDHYMSKGGKGKGKSDGKGKGKGEL